ncbi:RING finger protein 4 isoform X6 [Erpetoichthys calabaricus]|uniref:RING finger protein 4 isoform X6 n=1 Tax=Erpetoichthys calabaricus TaxID=27687 RepID=UPI002234B1AF|nr:RING finger protein 4 isoform X6 [Erpetoichthys calabaricus]
MSTTQRKRHSGTSSNSRRTSKRRRHRYTSSRMENETVQVLDNSMLDSAEVVDLTRDASEPVVVDLTNNDSVVVPGADGPVEVKVMLLAVMKRKLQQKRFIWQIDQDLSFHHLRTVALQGPHQETLSVQSAWILIQRLFKVDVC